MLCIFHESSGSKKLLKRLFFLSKQPFDQRLPTSLSQKVALTVKYQANECQNIMSANSYEKQAARGVSRGHDSALDHQRSGDDERDSTCGYPLDC
jgi:hypothetical protein